MVIRLSFVSGKLEGRVIQVPSRQLVSLGRTLRADISLEDDPLISSRHCEIEHNGSAGIVRDLGSTNGTYLNDQAIREAQLRHNDRLRIGSTELVIEFDNQPVVRSQKTTAETRTTTEIRTTTKGRAGAAEQVTPSPAGFTSQETSYGGPIKSYADSSVESGIVFPRKIEPQGSIDPPKMVDDSMAALPNPPPTTKSESPAVNPIMMSLDESSHIVGHFDLNPPNPKQVCDPPNASEEVSLSNRHLSAEPSRPVSPIEGLPDDREPPPADRLIVSQHHVIRALPPELTQFCERGCLSGVSLFQTPKVTLAAEVYTPSSLVDIIAEHFAVVAVLHFQRAQRETPQGLAAVHPLFDWLPENPARQYGPILVDYDLLCSSGNAEAIDQLWGADGCLLFFGPDRQQLFKHLSSLIHRAVPGLSREGGVFHFCWPSVLGQLLAYQPPEVAEVIFADSVAGVLTEIATQPIGWQIFAPSRFADQLRTFGLHRASKAAVR